MSASAKLHTGGRRLLNQILNGVGAKPATVYLGLRTLDGASGHPSDVADGDTLTSNLAEVSGGGYARIAITLNSTNAPESLSGADSILTFAQQTFNFTGSITGITHMFLATSNDNSGVLIASSPLATTRNVANGDQLKCTFIYGETSA